MNMMDSRSGTFPADTSLINPDFIQRLHEQRVLHKREAAFYMAQAEKHNAADEALESMILSAEKIVAILFPAGAKAADAPDAAAAEPAAAGANWIRDAIADIPQAAGPLTYNVPPAHALEEMSFADRAGTSGNAWRARILGGR
jgi:hypothetical protein